MKIVYASLACLLHVGLGGCVDYIKVLEESMLGEIYHFSPSIDAKNISPHPSILNETISVGKNCKGQMFKVPPIKDRNKKDRLYYLWFIDNKLAWPEAFIEPESRDDAIITLNINEQFLLAHFETKIPEGFYSQQHVIYFFVSDVRHTIPENRYVDDAKDNKEHSDVVYWIVTFSDDQC